MNTIKIAHLIAQYWSEQDLENSEYLEKLEEIAKKLENRNYNNMRIASNLRDIIEDTQIQFEKARWEEMKIDAYMERDI